MILLVGFGNPLCGDDGIGPHIAERLGIELESDLASEDLEILTVHQLTPELAEPVSRASFVIFIDAEVGSPNGKINLCELQPYCAKWGEGESPCAFSHHLNVSMLLEHALLLYGRRPRAFFYTVFGDKFGLGDAFSPSVVVAMPKLLDKIKARIAQCMNLELQNRS